MVVMNHPTYGLEEDRPPMNTYELAITFCRMGIATIPVPHREKHPKFSWKKYQTELPGEDDLLRWFSGRKSNLGILTGWEGLTVLDFDDNREYWQWLEWTQKEGSGDIAADVGKSAYRVMTSRGVHVYIRLPEAINCRRVGSIDIKSKGGLVIGESSIHPSGVAYKAMRDMMLFPKAYTLSDVLPATLLIQQTELPKGVKVPTLKRDSYLHTDPWVAASSIHTYTGGSLVDEIKQKYRIEQFFDQMIFTGTKHRLAICPFHDDQNESLWIDTSRQICNCFACNFPKPMDVIDFYARLYILSNAEAIRVLSQSSDVWNG